MKYRAAIRMAQQDAQQLEQCFQGAHRVHEAAVSMFRALGLKVADKTIQSLLAGLIGLAPILAVTRAHDPLVSPTEQEFRRGVGQWIRAFSPILLMLTLVVLVVYLLVIPFNFWEPFTNREVLIVYNAMLFAVRGLLVGATPLTAVDVAARDCGQPLRRGGDCLSHRAGLA